MSASIERIIAAVVARSRWGWTPADDENCDGISFGDFKDAIGSELHTIKKSLEEIAVALDGLEAWGEAAKLRAVAKDL